MEIGYLIRFSKNVMPYIISKTGSTLSLGFPKHRGRQPKGTEHRSAKLHCAHAPLTGTLKSYNIKGSNVGEINLISGGT